MKKQSRFLLAATFMALVVGIAPYLGGSARATVPGTNSLVSLRYTGTSAANDASGSLGNVPGFISADGKFVAFDSLATNIMSSGGAGSFMRNLSSGAVVRLNVSTAGGGADATTYVSGVSASGRYVIFDSTASNLIDGTSISTTTKQVYLRDTVSNTTTLISKDSSGNVANNGSEGYDVSSDGRFVLFSSMATNLHTDATNGYFNLYLLDRATNSLSVLNRDTSGTVTPSGTLKPVAHMSCDGSLVVFQSGANLSGSAGIHNDIYFVDRRGGTTLTNLTSSANWAALNPSISCRGDYIGFSSNASNLDTSVTVSTSVTHPFIYDRVNQTFYVADRAASTGSVTGGAQCSSGGYYSCISVSDTGIGLFTAVSSGLTGVSTSQVYLRNINTGTTELLSQSSSGAAANAYTGILPTISADGRIGVYGSTSTNLTSTSDTNAKFDVFTSLTGN